MRTASTKALQSHFLMIASWGVSKSPTGQCVRFFCNLHLRAFCVGRGVAIACSLLGSGDTATLRRGQPLQYLFILLGGDNEPFFVFLVKPAHYVSLSRPRSFAKLLSHGLPSRDIMEGGPVEAWLQELDSLFQDKISKTKIACAKARAALGWPPRKF